MKISYLLAVIGAIIYDVAAQGDISPNMSPAMLSTKIPKCALECFIKNVPTVCGAKGIYDYGCQCSNTAKLRPLITPCITSSCTSQTDQLLVAQLSLEICSSYYREQASKSPGVATATMASGPTSYVPAGGAAAAATAVPLAGALLGALAFAL